MYEKVGDLLNDGSLEPGQPVVEGGERGQARRHGVVDLVQNQQALLVLRELLTRLHRGSDSE